MTALLQSAATFGRGTRYKIGFVALVYLDLMLTLFALQHGFSELNPFMERMLSRPWELFLVKVVAPPSIAWLAPAKFLLPSIGFVLAAMGWNLVALAELL